jgi:hypothetical protein
VAATTAQFWLRRRGPILLPLLNLWLHQAETAPIRRECLNHVIVFNETHLRRILKSYIEYYHRSRTHLSLAKDAPMPRAKHLPDLGAVIEIAEVGGLHHRYERRAA